MTAEQYHAAAGVSRSMLESITPPKTPLHFWATHVAKIVPPKETKALRFGTMFHRARFEAESMEDAFYAKPDGMSFATKEGKAWKAAHLDKPIFEAKEAALISAVKEVLLKHPLAARILESSDFERSAFAEDNGLLLKSRFDALPRTGNVIADLKTIESADLESVEKAMFNYGYFRQAAFYLKVARLLGLDRSVFLFIFVEKTPPYAIACYQLADEVLEAGRMMIERDLAVIRECYANDKWPGYGESVIACGLPQWAMKQLEGIV